MSAWFRKLGPLLGLVFVFALFSVLRPQKFPTPDNLEIMLLQTAVVGTAALGMTIVIISGGIDLSVGSQIALCTVTMALLLSQGASAWAAALGGVAVGVACGALIGTLITRLKLPPFIVTLRMWGALRGSVERTKLIVYMLGSGFAALAGVLQFSYLTVGDPTTAAGMELDIIAAAVIGGGSLAGGEGSVLGSLIGALIMTGVANGCTKLELPNWVQEIVTGGIILAAVALDRLRRRRAE